MPIYDDAHKRYLEERQKRPLYPTVSSWGGDETQFGTLFEDMFSSDPFEDPDFINGLDPGRLTRYSETHPLLGELKVNPERARELAEQDFTRREEESDRVMELSDALNIQRVTDAAARREEGLTRLEPFVEPVPGDYSNIVSGFEEYAPEAPEETSRTAQLLSGLGPAATAVARHSLFGNRSSLGTTLAAAGGAYASGIASQMSADRIEQEQYQDRLRAYSSERADLMIKVAALEAEDRKFVREEKEKRNLLEMNVQIANRDWSKTKLTSLEAGVAMLERAGQEPVLLDIYDMMKRADGPVRSAFAAARGGGSFTGTFLDELKAGGGDPDANAFMFQAALLLGDPRRKAEADAVRERVQNDHLEAEVNSRRGQYGPDESLEDSWKSVANTFYKMLEDPERGDDLRKRLYLRAIYFIMNDNFYNRSRLEASRPSMFELPGGEQRGPPSVLNPKY